MATEMVRIEAMNETDREIINMLSPQERLVALREAAQRKVERLHMQTEQSYQEILQALSNGTLQPRTDYVRGYVAGEMVCVGESNEEYTWLGVVPGFEGKHLVMNARSKKMAVGGSQVRKLAEPYFDVLDINRDTE